MLIVKVIENDTMYSVQEVQLCIFSVSVILTIFAFSTCLVHSSTNLSKYFVI